MADMSVLVAGYKRRAAEVPRRAAVRLADLVVLGTPVDTGRLRSSFNATIGAPVGGRGRETGGAGYPQRSTVIAVANALQIGQSFSFATAEPYARRIEYASWSAQAPAGMLRVAVAQWRPIVDEAIRSVARGV